MALLKSLLAKLSWHSIFIAVLILTLIICAFLFLRHAKCETVVLLNGTSSSGKSAIIDEIRSMCPSYAIYKTDDWLPSKLAAVAKSLGWQKSKQEDPWTFLHDYMVQKTGKYYFDTELRRELFIDFSTFYMIAKEQAEHGKPIIVDTVLKYEKEYAIFDNSFKDCIIIKALVYCPLNVLLERVEKRNKAGKIAEMRPAFLSFEQFPAIYKVQEKPDEVIVDTIKTAVMKKALLDAIQDLIINKIPEPYLPKLEAFKEKFIEEFKLNERKEISLVPRHAYDLILKSGQDSPKELAMQLAKRIQCKI